MCEGSHKAFDRFPLFPELCTFMADFVLNLMALEL